MHQAEHLLVIITTTPGDIADEVDWNFEELVVIALSAGQKY